ncbi:MAG TPA: carboxyl transferase domain-containing protein [Euzebyales bacterium]|nr:carboxyl transferase domain-containing protein [Euzebyales bacterium]
MTLDTADLRDAVLDAGTWRSWDRPAGTPTADAAYAATLARARERTGLDEAVITGEGRIRGRRVAVVACEFAFLAGSIGVGAGRRLVEAVERATSERLPLLAAPASGGTRLQEGTVAFLQMVKVTAAIAAHKAAGLPYIVYLRHPTTGGVLASWGSLGHVTAAEPGALIGFLGPRVYEALHGAPFPPGVQTAENLYANGLVDAVVAREHLAGVATRVLDVLTAVEDLTPRAIDLPAGEVTDVPAARSIRHSRDPDRPGVRALLERAARDVTPLSGTGAGEREPGLVLALARFGTAPCLVIGQDRRGQQIRPLGPAGLREARRGIRVAAELGLPLVTVIDTPGAALSRVAEEGGLAGEIARCLSDLVTSPSPTLCLLLGEGAGGAALALAPADRVVAAQHAWLSPLPPEGASAVIHRDTAHADEMARMQGVRALDLHAAGIVDRVIAEQPPAAAAPDAFLRSVGEVIEAEVVTLLGRDTAERLATRTARYRELGAPR